MDVVDFIIKTSTITHPDYWAMINCEVINDFIRMRCFWKLMYLETLVNA